jgi:hypothetical protein
VPDALRHPAQSLDFWHIPPRDGVARVSDLGEIAPGRLNRVRVTGMRAAAVKGPGHLIKRSFTNTLLVCKNAIQEGRWKHDIKTE